MVLRMDCATSIDFTVRREAMAQIGGFDEQLPARQDWDLWIRITSLGFGLQEPTGTYINNVKGGGRISSGIKRKMEGTEKLYDKHFELFSCDPIAHRRILNVIGLMYILDNDREAGDYLRRSYDITTQAGKKLKLAAAILIIKVFGRMGTRMLSRYFALEHPDDYLMW
jgi:hypothetical protein